MKRALFGFATLAAATAGLLSACSGGGSSSAGSSGGMGGESTSSSSGGTMSSSSGGTMSSSSGGTMSSSSGGTTSSSSGTLNCMGSPVSSIDGYWLYSDTVHNIYIGWYFKGTSAGTFEVDVVRGTSAQTANDEKTTGTFTLSGSTLTLTPQMTSSCTPATVNEACVALQGGHLVLTNSFGMINYPPWVPPDAGNIAVTYGCFNAAFMFTPNPLHQAP